MVPEGGEHFRFRLCSEIIWEDVKRRDNKKPSQENVSSAFFGDDFLHSLVSLAKIMVIEKTKKKVPTNSSSSKSQKPKEVSLNQNKKQRETFQLRSTQYLKSMVGMVYL